VATASMPGPTCNSCDRNEICQVQIFYCSNQFKWYFSSIYFFYICFRNHITISFRKQIWDCAVRIQFRKIVKNTTFLFSLSILTRGYSFKGSKPHSPKGSVHGAEAIILNFVSKFQFSEKNPVSFNLDAFFVFYFTAHDSHLKIKKNYSTFSMCVFVFHTFLYKLNSMRFVHR